MTAGRWQAGLALAVLTAAASVAADPGPAPARQQELMQLLRQDCGSCHGLTLKGGLGPALTRDALAGKSTAMLQAVILHGRPGTPMPPWAPFMNDAEAGWLAEQLVTGVADAR